MAPPRRRAGAAIRRVPRVVPLDGRPRSGHGGLGSPGGPVQGLGSVFWMSMNLKDGL
jgi:hypothetical protein